ncbi:DUF3618 domain-containing protein [Mesobaculum littorinae]|uniref:DUF3618 domain-containing protein n=1 Tax=Mesobaculum littorinae TaxID=2486419 RepID=A0A438AIH0_9RHOB|nr:DUF3618 domain-containing protein [Mesobaculum littorinae]RVV98387.1 DUF3618 domain-containing protein [Mesobaculum littorinae]
MSYEPRTPEEIEREIAEERSQLTRTIGSIQDKLSFDHLFRGVSDSVSEHSSDVLHGVSRTVQRNPTALALTAAGLAWLAISNARSSSSDNRYAEHGPRYPEPRGPVPAGAPYPAELDDEEHHEEGSPWGRARASLSRYRADARARYGAAKASASERWAKARREGERRYGETAVSARQLRDRISDGTNEMSEDAKKRVMAARTRAYEAQVKAEYYARESREKATAFYDDQPLVVGGLAVVLGVAVGAALPRTKREDETFGAYRDDLFDEAERIYREERSKLGEVAKTARDETEAQLRQAGRDLKENASETLKSAEERAKTAAHDVEKATENEAKKQDFGNV